MPEFWCRTRYSRKANDADLEKLKGNDYVPFNKHQTFGVAKNRNVFVIQVESLQNFVINRILMDKKSHQILISY